MSHMNRKMGSYYFDESKGESVLVNDAIGAVYRRKDTGEVVRIVSVEFSHDFVVGNPEKPGSVHYFSALLGQHARVIGIMDPSWLVVFYRDAEDQLWVCPHHDFFNGAFEDVTPKSKTASVPTEVFNLLDDLLLELFRQRAITNDSPIRDFLSSARQSLGEPDDVA